MNEKNIKEKIRSLDLPCDQLAVFYLGQEGFLIKYQNTHILIDAYLSDYVDRNCSRGSVIWKRLYDAPIDASELDFIDYVFCTHPHYDHADPDTLSAIRRANADTMFIAPHILKGDLISYGIPAENIICADADIPITLDNLLVTPVPAAHEELCTDSDGHAAALGYIIQLGNHRIFHAGDCCIYDGLEERLKDIDIGFLPINGRDYYRLADDIIGNMDSREAILLAKRTKMNLLVPMHFDLYEINDVNPGYFVDCLYKFNRRQQFHMFIPSECYIWQK